MSSSFYPQTPDCQIHSIGSLYEQFFGLRTNGFFVEVGANNGLFVSNTWGLAQKNWHGVFVEPIPDYANQCLANYINFPNITVLQSAVGSEAQSELTVHIAGGISTASEDMYQTYGTIPWAQPSLTNQVITVPCCTLNQICNDNNVPVNFDLLVVDVEGFEPEVFLGFDLPYWRPKMMIIEISDTHSDLWMYSRSLSDLSSQITNTGYRIAYKDGINTVFVSEECWVETFSKAIR